MPLLLGVTLQSDKLTSKVLPCPCMLRLPTSDTLLCMAGTEPARLPGRTRLNCRILSPLYHTMKIQKLSGQNVGSPNKINAAKTGVNAVFESQLHKPFCAIRRAVLVRDSLVDCAHRNHHGEVHHANGGLRARSQEKPSTVIYKLVADWISSSLTA